MAAESTVRILFLGDSAGAVRSVSRLEGSFSSLGRTSKIVAGALGVALVGGLAMATKAAIDFQEQMELIHTQAGASTAEVQKMSKALLGLAGSVGTGPEELAKGLFHVESAGLRGAQALSVLKAAAEGAAVGQADLETVTNALIAAQTSGIKGAGSMEHAMAVLNATVGAGNLRMNDLASAMGTGILSSARAFGLSLQDVGAALGTMTVQGQSADASATRLRMAFSLMAAPTAKAIAALKTIGLTQDDLANTMRSQGLIPALAELKKHLEDSGLTATAQAQVIAAAFGGGRTSGGILTLIEHIGSMQARLEQINKTTGDFGEAWKATTETVGFQLNRAKAALQAAFIPIGTLLLPLVTRLAQAVGDAAQAIVDHMTTIQHVSQAAAQGIGRAWGQYATPAIAEFQKIAEGMAQQVQQNWPRIRGTARSVGDSIRSEMQSSKQIIQSLEPVLKALGPEFKVAFGLALIAIREFNTNVAETLKVTAAVIRAIAPAVAYMVASINKGVAESVSAFEDMAHGISTAFNDVIGAIKTLIGWIEKLIGWINKIPRSISIGVHGPGGHLGGILGAVTNPVGTVVSKIPHAHGGFVEGGEGTPTWVLAHAGEVILNKSQQAAFGGAGFFKRAFGFTEGGSSFAAGGIVGKKPAKTPHHSPHSAGKHLPRVGTPKLLAKVMNDINSFEDTKSLLDETYQNLSSRYSVLDGNQSFINDDGSVNTAFVSQRQTELLDLLSEREKLIATMDEEQAELDKGMKVLRAYIAKLVQRLKDERDRVLKDTKSLAQLTGLIAQESKKKKPDANKLSGWRHQISQLTADRSAAKSGISHMTSQLNDGRSLLSDWTHDATFLPQDEYGIQTDVIDLKQQLANLATPAAVIAQYGGSTAGTSNVDISSLLNVIANLNEELSLQGAQSAIIGSFAKGTLSVPETGLALVHAGEQIVPAGQVRGGGTISVRPVEVHLHVDDAMSWLKPYIRAEAVNASDAISVQIGRNATMRARSGRY